MSNAILYPNFDPFSTSNHKINLINYDPNNHFYLQILSSILEQSTSLFSST